MNITFNSVKRSPASAPSGPEMTVLRCGVAIAGLTAGNPAALIGEKIPPASPAADRQSRTPSQKRLLTRAAISSDVNASGFASRAGTKEWVRPSSMMKRTRGSRLTNSFLRMPRRRSDSTTRLVRRYMTWMSSSRPMVGKQRRRRGSGEVERTDALALGVNANLGLDVAVDAFHFRAGRLQGGHEFGVNVRDHVQKNGPVQGLLVGEKLVEGPHRKAGFLGHRGHGRPVETPPGKAVEGGRQDFLAVPLAFVLSSDRAGHHSEFPGGLRRFGRRGPAAGGKVPALYHIAPLT